jgi:hypothetical protein
VDQAERLFPPIFARGTPENHKYGLTEKPIPFLSLTQVSTQLRSEFRPLWLPTNRIPLCALERYLKAFYPLPKPKASEKAKARLASQFNPDSMLKLWIRATELDNYDWTKVFKLKVRFPNLIVGALAIPSKKDNSPLHIRSLTALNEFINTENKVFLHGIRTNKIVRVDSYANFSNRTPIEFRISMGCGYGQDWMLARVPDPQKRKQLWKDMGLSEVAKECMIEYRISYA